MGFLGAIVSLITRVVSSSLKVASKFFGGKANRTGKLLSWFSNIVGLLSMLWIFVITLPLILQVILIIVIFLVAIALVLVIVSVVSGGVLSDADTYDSNYTGDGAYVSVQDFLAFSQEELDMYGATLSESEKNIYRLGISLKDALSGYAGIKRLEGDIKSNLTFTIGISSIETGMKFYSSSSNNANILTTPSDIPVNSSGFGVLGLCGRDGGCGKHSKQYKLGILDDSERAALVSKHPLAKEPRPTINFYPYAAVYTLIHLNTKQSVAEKHLDEAMKVFDEWGLMANREENRTIVLGMMTQAGFHGVYWTDVREYATFWAALLHATSDIDAERSFYKWTIPNDPKVSFSESGVRISMYGSGGCHNFAKNGNPSTWSGTGTPILLNGVKLDVPVWTFLHEKYKGKLGWDKTVKLTTDMAAKCSASGWGAMTMNFHYGFNSFLVGNRVVTLLREKMPIPKNASATQNMTNLTQGGVINATGFVVPNKRVRTGFIQSTAEGKPQGSITIKGKTQSTASYLADYYSKKNTSYYNRLIKYTGKAGFYTNPKHMGVTNESMNYEPHNFFGVPFYAQTFKAEKGEEYNELGYGLDGEWKFGRSGCMVYSMSYVNSAISGKLINPAEMALILTARGGLDSRATSSSNDPAHGKITSELNGGNLKTAYKGDTASHAALMQWVTGELNKGNAMAIIRLGPPYSSVQAKNHYVVLTGAVMLENGEIQYSMYSSSNLQDTVSLHTLKQLSATGGTRARATVFYYK